MKRTRLVTTTTTKATRMSGREPEFEPPIFIIKKDGNFCQQFDYLEDKYGIGTALAASERTVCLLCPANMNDMTNEERWALITPGVYICHGCFKKNTSAVYEYLRRQCDKKRQMPRRMKELRIEIDDHRNLPRLPHKILFHYYASKTLYKEEKGNFSPDNNNFMRRVWSNLYHGIPLEDEEEEEEEKQVVESAVKRSTCSVMTKKINRNLSYRIVEAPWK